MEEKKEPKERIKRRFAPDGERSQKMMSFRLDKENEFWLSTMPNKGRYINDLIKKDRLRN